MHQLEFSALRGSRIHIRMTGLKIIRPINGVRWGYQQLLQQGMRLCVRVD